MRALSYVMQRTSGLFFVALQGTTRPNPKSRCMLSSGLGGPCCALVLRFACFACFACRLKLKTALRLALYYLPSCHVALTPPTVPPTGPPAVCYFCFLSLKPENLLLVDKKDDANLKIADFGFAKRHDSQTEILKTQCGTPGCETKPNT